MNIKKTNKAHALIKELCRLVGETSVSIDIISKKEYQIAEKGMVPTNYQVDTDWRKDMLSKIKTPLKCVGGCIVDATDMELASMNRNSSRTTLIPVERDELAKELVKRFNEYKGD